MRQLIEQARTHVASAANSAQTLPYWRVGERIRREVLGEARADYGEQIVSTLSTQLVRAYGQNFGLRSLRRMVVAVELKLEKFSPAHKGQMELYLRWLDQNDRAEGEASPIGLILCASADREQVELMDLDSANIRVAQYLHALPDVQVLQAQLHRVVQLARERQARLAPPDNKDET